MINLELISKKQNLMKLFFTTILTINFIGLHAQNGIGLFGNTQVHSDGELHIKNYEVHNLGVTQTHRDNPLGRVSVNQSANGNEDPEGFINGYLRTYQSGEYQFQVGSASIYSPISIDVLQGSLLDVAYNRESYHPEEIHESLDAVSGIEYWDVLGENSGKLTLFWKSESELEDLLDNLLELTIAGWNGEQWEIIASTVQTNSSLENGSIVSDETEDFSVYSAFTFAKLNDLGTEDLNESPIVMVLQNNVFLIRSTKEIDEVQIFDVSGRWIQQYKVHGNSSYQHSFSYPKGVYIAKILLKDGGTFTKKLMHK